MHNIYELIFLTKKIIGDKYAIDLLMMHILNHPMVNIDPYQLKGCQKFNVFYGYISTYLSFLYSIYPLKGIFYILLKMAYHLDDKYEYFISTFQRPYDGLCHQLLLTASFGDELNCMLCRKKYFNRLCTITSCGKLTDVSKIKRWHTILSNTDYNAFIKIFVVEKLLSILSISLVACLLMMYIYVMIVHPATKVRIYMILMLIGIIAMTFMEDSNLVIYYKNIIIICSILEETSLFAYKNTDYSMTYLIILWIVGIYGIRFIKVLRLSQYHLKKDIIFIRLKHKFIHRDDDSVLPLFLYQSMVRDDVDMKSMHLILNYLMIANVNMDIKRGFRQRVVDEYCSRKICNIAECLERGSLKQMEELTDDLNDHRYMDKFVLVIMILCELFICSISSGYLFKILLIILSATHCTKLEINYRNYKYKMKTLDDLLRMNENFSTL